MVIGYIQSYICHISPPCPWSAPEGTPPDLAFMNFNSHNPLPVLVVWSLPPVSHFLVKLCPYKHAVFTHLVWIIVCSMLYCHSESLYPSVLVLIFWLLSWFSLFACGFYPMVLFVCTVFWPIACYMDYDSGLPNKSCIWIFTQVSEQSITIILLQ